MKTSNIEKYFKQKNWSIPEIICVIAIIVAVIFILAISIPIGVPLGGVAVIVLVFIKSAKIKDAEVDRALNSLIEAHGIPLDPDSVVGTYDLKGTRVVKGKDGKLRSDRYVITAFALEGEVKDLTVYRIQVSTGQVAEETYALHGAEDVSLQEEAIITSAGRKTVYDLVSPAFKAPIPVPMDDVQASRLIEKVTEKR